MTHFVLAARIPSSSRVEYVITTARSIEEARAAIDPKPGERIGAAEISAEEWQAFVEGRAQPTEAMRVAVEATRR